MEEYVEILRLNDVDEELDFETARQIEDRLFSIYGRTLDIETKVKYEFLSLRRRLMDYSVENIGKDEYFEKFLRIIKNNLELGEYEEVKYSLVKLAYKIKAPTRFYTVLFNLKKILYESDYKYTRKDDDYEDDYDFGRKKK